MNSPPELSREGIRLSTSPPTEPVDVRFDDQWVWSFNPARDVTAGPRGDQVPWPDMLRPRLRGSSRVALVGHLTKAVIFDDEVAFTDAPERVSVVDQHGYPLGVDKAGRLQRRFDDTDQALRDHIVAAVDTILTDLREEAGLKAFLAFGCLLGALRTGKMIGHDADADVAYVSEHTHPLDIIRENRAAGKVMHRLGHRLVRMSAADFKIWIPLPDGRRCGVDVFGGYFLGDDFFLLPTVHGRLERSSLLPTTTVVLEGRELVAPAKPEDLLTVTYGPDWRVPDPAFQFDHPRWLTRHMDGYWRGARNRLKHWDKLYKTAEDLPTGPTPFARWADDLIGGEQDIVDVGAGNGRDAVWFAQRGHRVLALDYSMSARKRIRQLAAEASVEVEIGAVNLLDVRSTLVLGTRLAHDPKPRHVYARLLLGQLNPTGRREFFRFAQMVSRRGGLTLLEVKVADHDGPRSLIESIAALGGTVLRQEKGRDHARSGDRNPKMCRLAVRWQA